MLLFNFNLSLFPMRIFTNSSLEYAGFFFVFFGPHFFISISSILKGMSILLFFFLFTFFSFGDCCFSISDCTGLFICRISTISFSLKSPKNLHNFSLLYLVDPFSMINNLFVRISLYLLISFPEQSRDFFCGTYFLYKYAL